MHSGGEKNIQKQKMKRKIIVAMSTHYLCRFTTIGNSEMPFSKKHCGFKLG